MRKTGMSREVNSQRRVRGQRDVSGVGWGEKRAEAPTFE